GGVMAALSSRWSASRSVAPHETDGARWDGRCQDGRCHPDGRCQCHPDGRWTDGARNSFLRVGPGCPYQMALSRAVAWLSFRGNAAAVAVRTAGVTTSSPSVFWPVAQQPVAVLRGLAVRLAPGRVGRTRGAWLAGVACRAGASGTPPPGRGRRPGSGRTRPPRGPWWRRAARRWTVLHAICGRRGRGPPGRTPACRGARVRTP